ncbi:hypothetical protein [Dietzia maris]|uniref:hypothetical protein n=1 Tax=Dietzia maris TaxID=37915 RepID=UPI0034455F69
MGAGEATTTRAAHPGGRAWAAMALLVVVALLAPLNAAPTRAATPAGGSPISGMVDAHAHLAASQAFGGALRCGEPFSPGGLGEALADCPSHSGTGHFALLESVLGGTALPGGTQGFPTFAQWPSHDSQLHEQAYYTGIERAWRGGLRVLTNHLVANRVLCEALAGIGVPARSPCDEMEQLRRQVDYLERMEAHIDAEHGGPGRGWFRIARSPEDVRAIAADGKLAVTLGVEASEPFGCRVVDDVPMCTTEDIDRGLDEFASWGVSTVFPVHKFDNALGGARMDEELAGLAVNIGNKLGTQRFWETEPCAGPDADHAQPLASTPVAEGLAASSGAPAGAALPVYPEAPLCNVRGLTPLGEHAIRGMMARGMVINIDHMGVKTAHRTLDIAAGAGYTGLVVDHAWATQGNTRRVHEQGGFVAAFAWPADATENFETGFLEQWRTNTAGAARPFTGYGFGSDVNGLAALAEPRPSAASDPLVYPFTAPSGEVMDRWRFGDRVYDLNTDGVAQYGLYADWAADVLHRAGPDRAELERQLMGGAEAWTANWERAR